MHSCTRHGRMEHLEWRHTSGNYHRTQSRGMKALTVIYELPEVQWSQPVLKTPEGPNDGGTPTRLWAFPWGVQPGPHIKYQWENPLCSNRESALFFLTKLHLGKPRNESLTHLGSSGPNWRSKKKQMKWMNQFVVVQSLSHVRLFGVPWTTALQASLSFTVS